MAVFLCQRCSTSAACVFPIGKRHIDGHDYFYAVSEILDSAKDVIFILVGPATLGDFIVAEERAQDWWLSPELYLRYERLSG